MNSGVDMWPFGTNVLLAGLRKYLGAPNLQLVDIHPMPRPPVLPGEIEGEKTGQYRLRQFMVEVEINGKRNKLALLLKEFFKSQGSAGEHYFYKHLAEHLPVLTPMTIAGDDVQGWLVMLAPNSLLAPQTWTVEDYREAVDNLAKLHDYYWNLYQDLDTFANLRHPLDTGYPQLASVIQQTVQILTSFCPYPELATPFHLSLFTSLTEKLDTISDVLRQEPFTLLHTNYWPDTIARPKDGKQEIAHWHQAAIGPAILDAVMFAQQLNSHLNPLFPVKAALMRYQYQLSDRQQQQIWQQERWNFLWDYALVWLLMAEKLPWVVTLPPDEYRQRHEAMQRVWFEPAAQILETRFGVILP